MKDFFRNFSYKFRVFMSTRAGNDQLNWTLLALAVILSLAGRWISFLSILGTICLVLAILRCYSSNIYKRRRENYKFLQLLKGPMNSLKMIKLKAKDKDHVYVKCAGCKTILRAPKGKGRIVMTCPKCGSKTEIKS